ncbi:MAG: dihydropteroate synthase [Gemmatimonadaceae bacterium]
MENSKPAEIAREIRLTVWHARGSVLSLERPLIVGILNVTPDSFSDGGDYLTVESAGARVSAMLDEGMDIVDIGGESTRPGSETIDAGEEIRRVVPVVRDVRRRHPQLAISVDTTKSIVAQAALDEGANIINDVSAMRLDSRMATVVAESGAGVVLMHSRGGVGEMASYDFATYDGDVVGAVEREILEGVARATSAGVSTASIVIDPGVGFSKRSSDSIAVIRALPRLAGLGFPVLVGASRKRVIATLTGVRDESESPSSRVFGTIGAHVAALSLGARLFRVHDVRAHREALDAAWGIVGPATSGERAL